MIFVFDMDDTICDTDSYSEYYIEKFFIEHKMPFKKVCKVVRFAEQKFDWDKDTALNWYKTYGDEMMLNFPCKNGAKEIINKLYELGHTIIIATARADDWHTEPERITKEWLENTGLKYSKLIIGRVDKEKVCEEENADIFVDDDINITSRVANYFSDKKGKTSMLITTDYNKNLQTGENVVRIKDFFELKGHCL